MSLFACDVLPMFWKDSVKFTVLNASKSFAPSPTTACKGLSLYLTYFLQSTRSVSACFCETLFPLTSLNYLNFNLNGRP